jgi:hypothetical protein
MFLGTIELGISLGRMAAKAYKKVTGYIKNFVFGHKTSSSDPVIRVDTGKLRAYADRLESVNKRLRSLDNRMDSLYLKVGLRDLFNLIQADLMTGSSWRISNCAKYLDETANDFDSTERNVVGQF